MVQLALSKTVKFWNEQIELYDRTADKWQRRGRKILKRYKDVRTPREEAITRLNVLWSNVQTRLPALYSRDPKPEVERRFRDKDPVGRVVAEILERSLDYTVSHCNPFGRLLRQAILDYELPGRGTVWVRYVPHFHKVDTEEAQVTNTVEVEREGTQVSDDEPDPVQEDRLAYEETLLDYVYWEDFGHTWARTWEETRAIWRRVYLTRDEIIERFGEEYADVPLDWSPKNLNDAKVTPQQKKAIVYEIWDKQEREVIWICRTHPEALDKRDDPLHLTNFFPTPCPLMANLAADEFLPVPNFTFYQDQANEIDELSSRIASIGKALKVAGVRDSSAEGLDRLLSEGTENALVPVDGWMALKEKGGLQGVMELLPLKEIAESLGYLREQRQQLIDDVYEITGLSDIIRGLSDPNETATAQQIKGQFAVLRISDAQNEVQRYCRDLMRIMAELIADYDIETLKQISGVKLLTRAEKDQLLAQLQMSVMPPVGGQPPGAPLPGGAAGPQPAGPGAAPPQGVAAGGGTAQGQAPAGLPSAGGAPGQVPQNGPGIPPEKLQLLREPVWEDAAELLKNPVLREFRIDIETDSTIRTDEDADRQARMDFIKAVGDMIGQAANVPQDMIPAAGELILFGIRGFKVARSLERVFEEAIEKLSEAPPKPDPEMQKAQIEAQTQIQIAQMKAQLDAQTAQAQQAAQAQEDRIRTQAEAERSIAEQQAKSQHEAALKEMDNQFQSQKTQYETAAKERIAQADNQTKLQIAQLEHQHELQLEGMKQEHEKHITTLTQAHEEKVKGAEMENASKLKGAELQATKEVEQHKGAVTLQAAERASQSKEKIANAPKEAEAEKAKPTLEAIKELTKALEKMRAPRKVIRDGKGQISELH